jgi:hypothetical protein
VFHHSHKRCSVGHIPEYLWGDTFKSTSHSVFKFFSGLKSLLCNSILQVAPQRLTHGNKSELRGGRSSEAGNTGGPSAYPTTIPENITEVFPNSECEMCRCPVLSEPGIVLSTKVLQLRHETVL